MRVLITDCDHGFFGPEEEVARRHNVELVIAGGAPDRQRVLELGTDADALLCQYLRIDYDLMDALPNCRVIGRYGVGLDNIDVGEATSRGLQVVSVPDFCVSEVADHTLALALAVTRRITSLDRAWRADPIGFAQDWDGRFKLMSAVQRTSGRRFGVVGLGRIGQAVTERASSFGYEVVAHDPFVSQAGPVKLLGLDDLLRTSDVVSLHIPLSEDTRDLLDSRTLGLMKPESVLVNTSRGALINQSALVAALRAGRPSWAALDVFADEPLPPDSELFELPNLVLTPHVAFYSETSIRQLKHRALEAVIAAAASGA